MQESFTNGKGSVAILSMPLYLYSGAAVLVTVRIVKEIPLLNPNIIFIRGSFGTPEKIWLGRRRIFSLTTLITFLSYKCAKAHNIKEKEVTEIIQEAIDQKEIKGMLSKQADNYIPEDIIKKILRDKLK